MHDTYTGERLLKFEFEIVAAKRTTNRCDFSPEQLHDGAFCSSNRRFVSAISSRNLARSIPCIVLARGEYFNFGCKRKTER